MIDSYKKQLQMICDRKGYTLLEAIDLAGVARTTYYRAKGGADFRYETAVKIAKALTDAPTRTAS